jgi:putative nucleotidyltransferase with HDIG domain
MARRLDAGTLQVPVFPQAARRVLDACERDDCDARRIGEIVLQDPALAGHFLRIANSTAFAPRTPIVTLPQALARLGLSQIRQIAILVAVNTKAFSSKTRSEAAIALRQHSVATAMWAQEIARLRRHNVEEAFLCGLLQDVGTPALWQLAHDVEISGEAKASREEIDAHIDRLHERVGASIVRAWKLSDSVAATVGRHHALGCADETVAIVQLADAAARVKSSEHLAAAIEEHPSVAALSLYPEDIEEMILRASVVIRGIEALT